jgi:hypothetical protein
MTDPERISKRSRGLAAQLLQAGAEEQPAEASMQQTLAALGVSAAVVTTTSAASAAAGTAKATSALGAGAGTAGLGATAAGGTVKAVSAALLVKWIGIGVVGGVGLAGAAAVATGPATKPPVSQTAVAAAAQPRPAQPLAAPTPAEPELPSAATEVPAIDVLPTPTAAASHVSSSELNTAAPALEVGAPLAAEVAYVDRARALLAAGQAEQGLALLRSYEREFPEARLLPEVLFLQLETCARVGRQSEARAAAQRLLDGFPKSPHASRARKLLFP